MCILAIDTAGETASAAVIGPDGRITEKMNTDSLDHLKSLMQLVSEALAEAGTDKQELESIAVTTGPGSFTGIRIGMAAARTLAQVLGIKVAPVMTLDAYCFHDYGMQGPFLLCPMTALFFLLFPIYMSLFWIVLKRFNFLFILFSNHVDKRKVLCYNLCE